MTIETYIALLHEDVTPTKEGRPVLCPLQPDGTAKPVIDHDGVLYHLIGSNSGADVFDYTRAPRNA
ncbi:MULTISPECIES: hypothetical protein [Microbacterium]|uniref:hypothetical protein n=1 Tax=Microbacterium TaxID=33882 RepID=UPI001F487202|nr:MULTISPECIES: hypothetical protein [Microbacterium]WRK17170.1 hypothetical protein VC184_14885 [Microbacterium plantarum]